MPVNRAQFYAAVRANIFGGRLQQSQVDGMNVLLDTWDASTFQDLRWLAYMLGTAYHETRTTRPPIREFGDPTYFTRMYDVQGKRPSLAQQMGNTQPGDGEKYCGRGFVQLTWKNNYERAGALLDADLVNNPD